MPTSKKPMLGNTRVTGKEQFYTPTALADRLVGEVVARVTDFHTRTVLEPAGGTGAFVDAADRAGAARILSIDIEPKHEKVSRADFLEHVVPEHNAITISNPPFGRNNSLSIPFFNRAADYSEYICFIVPRSWRKWSVINRLDRRFELVHDEDLQIDYEDEDGKRLVVQNRLNTCFQIWRRSATPRPLVRVVDNGIVTKTSSQLADVALTVFGFNCGRVRTEFERRANSTQMFLKLNHPDALKALQTADFSRFYKNTAYTEALSLQEINYLLNEIILGNPQLEEVG
jgi:predicted RNA methylase